MSTGCARRARAGSSDARRRTHDVRPSRIRHRTAPADRAGAADRPDIPRANGGRLGPDHLRHVRFGVHGPHLAEPAAQREGELAGPAGQIQQAPALRDPGTPDQVRDHRLRVRQPVPVVVPGAPPVQIRPEPHLVHQTQPSWRHRPGMLSSCRRTMTRQAAPYSVTELSCRASTTRPLGWRSAFRRRKAAAHRHRARFLPGIGRRAGSPGDAVRGSPRPGRSRRP
jgi:hypothetical protein